MEVDFDGVSVQPGQEISWEAAQSQLHVHWPHDPSRSYLLIFYDQDAGTPEQPFIHYLVEDLHQENLMQGQILIPYLAPNPPDYPHTYQVEIYQQSGLAPTPRPGRTANRVGDLVAGQSLVASSYFKVAPHGGSH